MTGENEPPTSGNRRTDAQATLDKAKADAKNLAAKKSDAETRAVEEAREAAAAQVAQLAAAVKLADVEAAAKDLAKGKFDFNVWAGLDKEIAVAVLANVVSDVDPGVAVDLGVAAKELDDAEKQAADRKQAADTAAKKLADAEEQAAQANRDWRDAASELNAIDRKHVANKRRTAAARTAREHVGLLSSDWVESVASTREGDLRAHQIAYTYHRFARALDEWIYDDELDDELDVDPTLDPCPDDHSVWWSFERRRAVKVANVNWFGFATWATISINRDIRNQRPPLRSERVLPVSLRPWLSPTIMNIKAADGQRISRVLSWGQRLVFLSTTGAFLALLEQAKGDENQKFELKKNPGIDKDRNPTNAKWANQVCALAQWDGQSAELQFNRHLEPVAEGFECFRRARIASKQLHGLRADAPKEERDRLKAVRARRVLMGNVLITAVEQDVVQSAVRTVIEHVPDWLSTTVSVRLARLAERYNGVSRRLAASDIPIRLLSAREKATEFWARVMTDQILVMMLPTETLRLGRDIPALRVGEPYFSKEFADLATLPGGPDPKDPVQAKEIDDLVKLVSAFDRSRANGAGTGASDWRRYDERMNWALSLLRTRQRDHTLFWSPYSSEDGKRILRGRLPQRVGDPSDFEVIAPLEGDFRT